jgi:uncharacterized protein
MTSYLIDINVWLAMSWDLHPQHRSAARWYAKIRDEQLLFCRFTMLGFLRLLTNRQVMGGSTTTLGQALEIYDRWIEDPRVRLAAEPDGMEMFLREAAIPFLQLPATKAVADCYLAGFAQSIGARLVTFDKALAADHRGQRNAVVLLKIDGATA